MGKVSKNGPSDEVIYHFKFLKAVFHKSHLVHSWIHYPVCSIDIPPAECANVYFVGAY